MTKDKIGKKFLPIGTVVMLKGGKKRVMISGFCAISDTSKNEMWDYSGCMYPEGFVSSNQTLLFDHSQIAEVYHMGLVDEEEETFKKNLNVLLEHLEEAGIQQKNDKTENEVVKKKETKSVQENTTKKKRGRPAKK